MLIFFFLSVFCRVDAKIVVLPLKEFSAGYAVFFRLGNSTEVQRFIISTTEDSNWVIESFVPHRTFNQSKALPVKFNNKEYFYEFVCEEAKINKEITISNFCYNHINKFPPIFEFLTLKRRIKERNYSIINTLIKSKHISSDSFGISLKNKKRYSLFLGGLPGNLTNKRHSSSCDVNINNDNWSCTLNAIKIDDKEYVVNDNIIFSLSREDKFEVPKKFYDFLVEQYFQEDITKGKCKKTQYLLCEFEVMDEKFGEIVMIFKDFRLDIMDLLLNKNYDDYIVFLISESKRNEWVIGPILFKKYVPLFNNQENKITFYSKKSISNHYLVVFPQNLKTKIIFINILILGFGAGIIIILLNKNIYMIK